MQVPASQVEHLVWSIFFPLATDSVLDSMVLCLHPQGKYNEFHTIKAEDFPQMDVVSLTPECQLRNILMSFLTLGWSLCLFFPFRHHIKPLSFSGLYCWDCFANLLSTHQEERASSAMKTCMVKGYAEVDTKLTNSWTLLCFVMIYGLQKPAWTTKIYLPSLHSLPFTHSPTLLYPASDTFLTAFSPDRKAKMVAEKKEKKKKREKKSRLNNYLSIYLSLQSC